MFEQEKLSYRPDRVSPPGDTLADLLEERGMSQAELAERTGRPIKTINEIIKGKSAITPETALQLERVLGTHAEFWNQREANFRAYIARQRELESLSSHKSWLAHFPIKEMRKRGWISCDSTIPTQMIGVLNFFAVATPEQWEMGWTKRRLAFRKAMNLDLKAATTSVWLRQGEIEGEKINCKPFSKEQLVDTLPKIRALTKERDPNVFIPKLTELCAECGVAVVFVQPFVGVPVYGSSSWLNSDKALIQLSIRGKTADILWFTIFHELGHILKHSKKEMFVEIDDRSAEKTPEENEADEFAAETLIPRSRLTAWLQASITANTTNIQKLADDLGIAPGIIVGRLQHIKKLRFDSTLNSLKFRYQWVSKSQQD